MLYLRLVRESLLFALNALRNNKLRTTLSLLGVTIGIFSIIAILTAVDSMENNIKKDIEGMDNNMLFIAPFSFGPTDIPSWKSKQFPKVTYQEYEYLKKNIADIEEISYNFFVNSETITAENESVKNIQITPCSYSYQYIDNLKIAQGRFFNEGEDIAATPVVVLGHSVAENLFGNSSPLGKNIRLYGKKFTVIGVLEKQGNNSFGNSKDIFAYISSNFIRNLKGENTNAAIVVKPKKNIDPSVYKEQITQKLRHFRGIRPDQYNNFFLNEFSGLTNFIDDIISKLNLVGWIISGFSLLVGGFGIANIMFVSVKERTNIIGIQKSLGAKKNFILFQFLFEAIILALIGGLVGIIFVWLIAISVSSVIDFQFQLGIQNIIIGLALASTIGLLSGLIPAIFASKLNPVDAIRTGM